MMMIVVLSISSTFYEQLLGQYFCAKKLQSQTVIREKHFKTLLFKKAAHKLLMKLTPPLPPIPMGFPTKSEGSLWIHLRQSL